MSSVRAGRAGRASRLGAAFRRGPLEVRDFRLFSIGQLTSTAGDFCYAVALPWMVLSAHGGTVLLGTVLACYGVPRTVLIPVGGSLTDRLSPRTVMLAADSVRCVLVAVLALFAARGLVSIAFLGPVAALIGAGEGIFLPASAAIMPSLLPAGDLQAGNGLSSAAIQVGSLAGPVLGGILVTVTGGSATAFAVDAATFAASATALAFMRGTRQAATAATGTAPATGPADTEPAARPAAGPTGDTPAESASVWRLLRTARELQTVLVIAVLANFVIAGAFEVALPTLAHSRFAASGYGAMIASFGLGSLLGTLIAAKQNSLRYPAVATCAAFAFAGVALALIPFLGGLPGAAAAAAVFGGAGYFGNVVIVTLLQQWAPPHLLGRVMSLVMLAAIGAFPVSVALSGVIVGRIGPAPFFPVAGAVLALAVLVAATQRQFRNFGAQRISAGADAGTGDGTVEGGEPGQAAVVEAR
ncbi:MAG: MFS transporter [Streptosporangiaceae bacterium]